MAEDFRAAFGLGTTAEGISAADAYGVALAAIQALRGEIAARDQTIAGLEREVGEIKAILAEMSRNR